MKVKKGISLTSLICLGLYLLTSSIGTGTASAAVATSTPTVNLTVNPTISNNCTSPVTMGAITGTGQSTLTTNSTTCTVITNNSAGYKLEWTASAATMASGGNTIAAYTPAVANIPDTWTVASTDSEWGAHLGSASTTADTAIWGAADTYAGGKWLNVATAPRQIISRGTPAASDSEIVFFGSEIGSTKFQQTGTYTVNVTFTATTL